MFSSMLNLPQKTGATVASLTGLQAALHPAGQAWRAADPEAERLAQLQAEFEQHAGAGPNGTGDTGLLPNDAQGYSDLAARRAEYLALQKKKAGSLAAVQQMVNQ